MKLGHSGRKKPEIFPENKSNFVHLKNFDFCKADIAIYYARYEVQAHHYSKGWNTLAIIIDN